ncbi:MAG: hypothetical protein MJE68_22325, partial [Proteobacteria bacterium]|nr:hypothetical protein [Pseudomonadota bacterium]
LGPTLASPLEAHSCMACGVPLCQMYPLQVDKVSGLLLFNPANLGRCAILGNRSSTLLYQEYPPVEKAPDND